MTTQYYNKIIELLKDANVNVKPMKTSKFKEASRLTDPTSPKTNKMLQSILLDTNFDSPAHLINYASKSSKEFDNLPKKDKYSALTRTIYNLPKKESGPYKNSEVLQALLQRAKNPIQKTKKSEHYLDKMLGKIPNKGDESQKWLESYVENLFKTNPTTKELTEYLADDDANRSNLLKALQYNKRKGERRALDTAIFRKEHEPKTRHFTMQELKSKYFPAHVKRGRKFDINEEQKARYLDKIFDDFENYRDSTAFKNFRGDKFPKLTDKEYSKALDALIYDNSFRGKKTKLYDYITNDYTADFENAIVKSKKKLFPNEPFEETMLSPEQMTILKDFFIKQGKPIYREPVRIDSKQVKDAINRAEMEKYLNKPQKLIQPDNEYDGFTFKDFYDILNED